MWAIHWLLLLLQRWPYCAPAQLDRTVTGYGLPLILGCGLPACCAERDSFDGHVQVNDLTDAMQGVESSVPGSLQSHILCVASGDLLCLQRVSFLLGCIFLSYGAQGLVIWINFLLSSFVIVLLLGAAGKVAG